MIDTTFLHNTVSAHEGMTAYDTGAVRRAKVQPALAVELVNFSEGAGLQFSI